MDVEQVKRLLEKPTASVGQTAAAIGFSEKRTYEAVRAGKIPSVGVGPRKRRVPTSWLAQQLGMQGAA